MKMYIVPVIYTLVTSSVVISCSERENNDLSENQPQKEISLKYKEVMKIQSGDYVVLSCSPVTYPKGFHKVMYNDYTIESANGLPLSEKGGVVLDFFCGYRLSSRIHVEVSGYFIEVAYGEPWDSFPSDCPEADYLSNYQPGEFFRMNRIFKVTGINKPASEHNRYMRHLESKKVYANSTDLSFVQSIDFEKAYKAE